MSVPVWGLNTDIKVSTLESSTLARFAEMLSCVSACELAVAPISSSSVTGRSSGSIHISVDTCTSVSYVAVRFQLCLIDGELPLAQDVYVSLKKKAPTGI